MRYVILRSFVPLVGKLCHRRGESSIAADLVGLYTSDEKVQPFGSSNHISKGCIPPRKQSYVGGQLPFVILPTSILDSEYYPAVRS
jgi:hypothetical protein